MSTPVPDFSPARVLVAGDVMLDRYWSGSTSRISPEAPVPVVRVREDEARPGGAANVALNLAALGAQASVLGVVGADEAGAGLARSLEQRGVSADLLTGTAPTITKLRVMSRHQQLLRLDFEEPLAAAHDSAEFARRLRARLPTVDVLVLSDYGKGSLAGVAGLIAAARAAGKPVLVDPKGNDWRPYTGATLLTPNTGELEAVVGPCPDVETLVAKGQALLAELGLGALLVTRSEHGMTLLEAGKPPLHLPAEAREVYDVTGAGDTVIATLAAALAAGAALPQACRLANIAAGVVVGKLGTATVSRAELARAANPQRAAGDGVLDEPELLARVAEARARGRRLVMTNGCFDILHVGHVRYLQAARELGDVLIVAVNTDASVQRLKGPTRPLNNTADRMTLLAALQCVDWVVPFGEDTPARLIEAVLPDVLVKGGDYQIEQIAGHEAVLAHGGEVRVLGFHDGYSTTRLIERARK